MINSSKNYYFIFISILLAFIISIFYNKIMDIKFLLIFITLSLFLYIVFYYLGSSKENYIDYNPYYSYDSSNNHIIRDNLEEEETRIDTIKDLIKTKKMEHEEETYYPQVQEETKNDSTNIITKPDINKFVLENPIKNSSPLNINISYNSQNSVNEIDNNSSCNKECNKERPIKENKSKNLGNNCDNSRIYNNSDWIYGSSAWNNDPDYYIPEKNRVKEIPQPLNELINTRKYKEDKNVCPLMINTPWSEYKSGDSEPEPYNL